MDDTRQPTSLYPLPSLPFPLTVQRIRAQVGQDVSKTQALFSYSHAVRQPDGSTDKRVDFWDSPVDGQIKYWYIQPGQVLTDATQCLVDILEPCTHDVQLHGLCALCGKDLTEIDYTGFSQTSRAAISMVHDEGGLTVSLNEASRLEEQTAKRLLDNKKLSLIVDLDQTIIHATVDPTVGEWLADESNPNHDALKDVSRFQLEEERDGLWYYVKPRPGLSSFLRSVKDLYEMHVYTMGTRAYASKVCNVIDPDGSLFGGRILSRDESGSLTRKSIQRLFPCDTSMVVIIDDRADVWDASPNLLKVIPYDFFVGIGDINAAFLPKKQELPAHPALDPTSISSTPPPPSPASSSSSNDADLLVTPSSIDKETDDVIAPAMSEAEASQAKNLASQIEERPLSKVAATTVPQSQDHDDSNQKSQDGKLDTKGVDLDAMDGESDTSPRAAVLHNNDHELARILQLLQEVHRQFFDAKEGQRRADVKTIVPGIKRQVLKDVKMSFSGLIALGTRAEDSEYWKTAITFGAQCFSDLHPSITHLVAAQPSTEKVHKALKRTSPPVKVVWTQWLLDCVAHWRKLDEQPYLLQKDASSSADGGNSTGGVPSGTATPAIESDGFQFATADEEFADDILNDDDLRVDDIDWGDAAKEIEDALNDTDDSESDLPSPSRSASASKKRVRISTGSTNGDEGTAATDDGNSTTDDDETRSIDSPLQKRVKTSRSRQSRLKHSVKLDSSEADAIPAPVPPPPSSSLVANEANASGAATTSPSRGESQRSSELDSDDEAFFASMAAEVEKGFGSASS